MITEAISLFVSKSIKTILMAAGIFYFFLIVPSSRICAAPILLALETLVFR